MFTQNYINYQKGIFMSSGYTIKTIGGISQDVSVNAESEAPGIGYSLRNGYCKTISGDYTSATKAYSGVWFGTDSTPPTRDDVTLPGLITSGLTIESMGSLVGKEGDGRYVACGTYNVKNTSSKQKNICEIGIFSTININTSNMNYAVLMERTVLSEPISLQPGEETIITHKIIFNQTVVE